MVVRSRTALVAILAALVLAGIGRDGGIGEAGPATSYVRTDGDDDACNGGADAPAAQAPNCAYGSIDWAVDQAPADTRVLVGAGTYSPLAIFFSQNITIEGQPGTKPLLQKGAGGGAWFTCMAGVRCTLRNLAVDANNVANVVGINYIGSGVVSDVTFTNFVPGLSPDTAAVRAYGVVEVEGSAFDNVHVGVEILGGSLSGVSGSLFTNGSIGVSVTASNANLSQNRFTDMFLAMFVGRASLVSGPAHAIVLANDFGNSHIDLDVGRDSEDTSGVDAHFNRFGLSGGLHTTTKATAQAENNWWGCNSGPAIYPDDGLCADILPSLPLGKVTPWLVMTVALPPATNGPRPVSVDFNHNSAGDLVTTAGIIVPAVDRVLDGIDVTFGVDPEPRGTINPTAGTVAGVASATFAPALSDGIATIAISLDGQRTERSIMVDHVAPSTRIKGPKDGARLKRLGRAGGTAADAAPSSGIGLVELALRRKIGETCAIWTGTRWLERGCKARRWLKANGRINWGLLLPDSPPGLYSIFSRATDRAGNRSAAKFVRGKNFIAVTIVPTPMGARRSE